MRSNTNIIILIFTNLLPTHHTSQDETKEMHMYSSLRTRKKTTEDIIQQLGGLREEVRRVDSRGGAAEARVAQLSEDMNARFDMLFK